MPDITLTTLQSLKLKGEKITMLTCYDATFAHASCQAGVEVLLVGDSLGMVLQGHDSTLPVSLADMAYHTAAVKRGNQGALILADLPFMAYATLEQTFASCAALMQAGAHMIKLEGAAWLAEPIRQLAERGVPVCAHLGLTPQAVNVFGGYKVQGRGAAGDLAAEDALALAEAMVKLPNLQLRGIMSIPDDAPDFEAQCAVHKKAKAVFESIKASGLAGLEHFDTLSMGMTGDLDAAVAAGSTMVRVGSGIFGRRTYGTPTP